MDEGPGTSPSEAAEPVKVIDLGKPPEYVFVVPPGGVGSKSGPFHKVTPPFPGLELEVRNYSLMAYEITISVSWVERAIAAASNPEVTKLSQSARADLQEVLQETRPTSEQGVIAALQSAAQKNPELASLSFSAQQDLRLKILALIPAREREALSAVMTMQSAEAVGSGLARASWALVVATVALVIATGVLVYITAFPHTEQPRITVVVPTPSPSRVVVPTPSPSR